MAPNNLIAVNLHFADLFAKNESIVLYQGLCLSYVIFADLKSFLELNEILMDLCLLSSFGFLSGENEYISGCIQLVLRNFLRIIALFI